MKDIVELFYTKYIFDFDEIASEFEKKYQKKIGIVEFFEAIASFDFLTKKIAEKENLKSFPIKILLSKNGEFLFTIPKEIK